MVIGHGPMRRRNPRLIAAFAALFFIRPVPAHACSCAVADSAHEAWIDSALVFTGRFVDNEGEEEMGQLPHNFEVDRVWKGPVSPILTVYTSDSDASCGYPFQRGESYLVYAHFWQSEGVFSTGLCSRNSPIAMAGGDMRELGVPRVPPGVGSVHVGAAARAGDLADTWAGVRWFVLSGIASGIMAAGVLHVVWRRGLPRGELGR